MLSNDLLRHRMEFARAIDNHQYELTPQGVHFPKQRVFVCGQFDTWVNGADHQVDPNVVPTEALNYLLKAGFKASGATSTWYIAPFLNNTTPLANLTAALFDSTLNEFTAYTEAARQAFTLPADPTAGVFDNSAAPAVFTADNTVGTGAGVDVYGAGILSVSTKEATGGVLACASKFNAARNLKATDKLTIQYTISATSST